MNLYSLNGPLRHGLLAMVTSLALLSSTAVFATSVSTQNIEIAPGGDATLNFSFDFSPTLLNVAAFNLFLTFDTALLDAVDFSGNLTPGPTPDFGNVGFLLVGPIFDASGYSVSWFSADFATDLQTLSGQGTFSVLLHNVGLAEGDSAMVTLTGNFTTFDLVENFEQLDLAPTLASVTAVTSVSVVPEPNPWLMMMAGLGAMGVVGQFRARSRRSAALAGE